jgi:hypothetical protein
MEILLTGEKEMLKAFGEMLQRKLGFNEWKFGEKLEEPDLILSTENKEYFLTDESDKYDLIFDIPEEWDKVYNIIKSNTTNNNDQPLDNFWNKYDNATIEWFKNENGIYLIGLAKEKGYKGGMWIWDGRLKQIPITDGIKKRSIGQTSDVYQYSSFSFKDNKLYLNDTCIYDNGEWKLLFIPREIYTITGSNHFITFKYKNIKNDAINSYEEYGSELGYYSEPQCVLKSSDNPRAIRKASASEKLRLIDERNKAGYIWNGEELERIKPKLSLFGYDVEVTSDIVKIGCKVRL